MTEIKENIMSIRIPQKHCSRTLVLHIVIKETKTTLKEFAPICCCSSLIFVCKQAF
jgi:hypothetical protein